MVICSRMHMPFSGAVYLSWGKVIRLLVLLLQLRTASACQLWWDGTKAFKVTFWDARYFDTFSLRYKLFLVILTGNVMVSGSTRIFAAVCSGRPLAFHTGGFPPTSINDLTREGLMLISFCFLEYSAVISQACLSNYESSACYVNLKWNLA
jgi:hypothetical protein